MTGAPFSAETVEETVQKLEDGGAIRKARRTRLFRDGKGRTREEILGRIDEDSGPANLAVRRVFISDPGSNVLYLVDARQGATEQTTIPGLQAAAYSDVEHQMRKEADRREEAAGWIYLGKRSIEGVETVGSRRTQVIEAGRIGNDRDINIVFERWYSPELQLDVLRTESDPRRGEKTYQLTNIRRIEPLPALFEPPPDHLVSTDDDR